MAKYNVYNGQFKCQQCGAEVYSLRSYPELKELTWMCEDKHVSRVNLNIIKKTKKDYERKERK
jgi:hypothetical protein